MKILKWILLPILILIIVLLGCVQGGVFNKTPASAESLRLNADGTISPQATEEMIIYQDNNTIWTETITYNNSVYVPAKLGLSLGTGQTSLDFSYCDWNFVAVETIPEVINQPTAQLLYNTPQNFIRRETTYPYKLTAPVYWNIQEQKIPATNGIGGKYYIPRYNEFNIVEEMIAYWIYPICDTATFTTEEPIEQIQYTTPENNKIINKITYGDRFIQISGARYVYPIETNYPVSPSILLEEPIPNGLVNLEPLYSNMYGYGSLDNYRPKTDIVRIPQYGLMPAGLPVRLYNILTSQGQITTLLNVSAITPPTILYSEIGLNSNTKTYYRASLYPNTPTIGNLFIEGTATFEYANWTTTITTSQFYALNNSLTANLSAQLTEQYELGYTRGKYIGDSEGYNRGYKTAIEQIGGTGGSLASAQLITNVVQLLNLELLPGFSISSIIMIIVAFSLLGLIFKILRD